MFAEKTVDDPRRPFGWIFGQWFHLCGEDDCWKTRSRTHCGWAWWLPQNPWDLRETLRRCAPDGWVYFTPRLHGPGHWLKRCFCAHAALRGSDLNTSNKPARTSATALVDWTHIAFVIANRPAAKTGETLLFWRSKCQEDGFFTCRSRHTIIKFSRKDLVNEDVE